MYFYSVMFRRFTIVIVFCVVCIISQSSGWLGYYHPFYDIYELLPPNDGYIINNICAYHEVGKICTIGNITWSNGVNSFQNRNFYGSVTDSSSCFEALCINNITSKASSTALTELELGSSLTSQRWGYDGERNSNIFFCKPNHCVSKIKVAFAWPSVTAINVECVEQLGLPQQSHTPTLSPSMSTNTPTQSPTEIPTMFPITTTVSSKSPTTTYPSNISSTTTIPSSSSMSPTSIPIEISIESDSSRTSVEANEILITIGVLLCAVILIAIILLIYKKRKHRNNKKSLPNYMSANMTASISLRSENSNIIILNTNDTINYKNWDANDVVKWILKLDDEFKIYKNNLKKYMVRDQVNGSNMHLLTANDLSLYGIRNMEHRYNILNSIKKLIASNVDAEGVLHEE